MSWYGGFRPYVPVAKRRAAARRQMDQLRKQGHTIEPIEIEGRTIARSFWGKGWCEHLESFSDFSNRLPRGRTYVRNGSVCHLAVKPGMIEAHVAGSELYRINIRITKLDTKTWEAIKRRCAGQIGSILELLQGKLSDRVMAVVADRQTGLFPKPGQIKLDCSCPDWATMCKHVAAVLYGVGNRLDARPELLFTLRGVDPQELIAAEIDLPDQAQSGAQTLADEQLSDVFGIDLDEATSPAPTAAQAAVATAKSPARRGAKANRKSKTTTRVRAKAKRKSDNQRRNVASRSSPDARKMNKTAPRGIVAASQATRRAKAQPLKHNGKPTIRPTGKSIARLRRQAGLTQVQFAEKLRVSAASVARWEATVGRVNLQLRCLEALSDLKHHLNGRS